MKEKNSIKKLSSVEDFKKLTTEEKILLLSSGYKVPDKLPREEIYAELSQKMGVLNKSGSLNLLYRKHYIYWGIAATVLLLVGLFIIIRKNDTVNILAYKGTHADYLLPDNSVVFLNADSKISYSRSNFTEHRHLKLTGEAFFITKNGTDFVVSTKFGIIKTLGTTFDVNSRADIFKVSCLTGKVFVLSFADSVIVTERESVLLSGNTLKKITDENIERTAAWRYGEFHFNNMPLNLVFNEIERQFNVTIDTPETGERFFTGSFYKKDLKEALDIVCIPMGLTYEIQNNKRILVSNLSE